MRRLNETESTIIKFRKISLFRKDPFFLQIAQKQINSLRRAYALL